MTLARLRDTTPTPPADRCAPVGRSPASRFSLRRLALAAAGARLGSFPPAHPAPFPSSRCRLGRRPLAAGGTGAPSAPRGAQEAGGKPRQHTVHALRVRHVPGGVHVEEWARGVGGVWASLPRASFPGPTLSEANAGARTVGLSGVGVRLGAPAGAVRVSLPGVPGAPAGGGLAQRTPLWPVLAARACACRASVRAWAARRVLDLERWGKTPNAPCTASLRSGAGGRRAPA
jgi:hypothetical protein